MSEQAMIELEQTLRNFVLDVTVDEMSLPPVYQSRERTEIHKLCSRMGLTSKSRGKKSERYIMINKPYTSMSTYTSALLETMESGQRAPNGPGADAQPGTSKAGNSPYSLCTRASVQSRLDLVPDCESMFNLEAWLPIEDAEKAHLVDNPNYGRLFDQRDLFGLKDDLEKMKQCQAPCNTVDRLVIPQPIVPNGPTYNQMWRKLMNERQNLPIFAYRKEILRTISEKQVTLIIGETGSGKSTQMPQFILDEMAALNQRCRVIVTEPRRIAAVTVAERCANERGENLGETIGYQIRLQKEFGPKTCLTFCTNGILLRTLIGARRSLSSVTHLIIDEVHERDKMSDFLITVIRQLLPDYPHLRIILMSASMNKSKFVEYFENPAVIEVPGRSYNVTEYHLEEVLRMVRYRSKGGFRRFGEQYDAHEESDPRDEVHDVEEEEEEVKPEQWEAESVAPLPQSGFGNVPKFGWTSPKSTTKLTREQVDELLDNTWEHGETFDVLEMVKMIERGQIDLCCRHSQSMLTPLAIAAGRGVERAALQLLEMSAAQSDPLSFATAAYLARLGGQKTVVRLLDKWKVIRPEQVVNAESPPAATAAADGSDGFFGGSSAFGGGGIFSSGGGFGSGFASASAWVADSDGSDPLLDSYLDAAGYLGDQTDGQLVVELVHYILSSSDNGAILIFLSGYEDIIFIRDKLQLDVRLMQYNLTICMLHSQMQSRDQKEAFLSPPQGSRKVILSTNIAEVSVTINDVVFVIDSGRMKEKMHDGLSGISMLCNVWISKVNALQRKGRAGRCSDGFCYRLYSKLRYQSLSENPVPEILRVPIHELCLQTKLLFPEYRNVADLLGRAPDPPSPHGINNALNLLKAIGAITESENLTRLGRRIVELPVEPQFSKMLIFGILFKCIDPILTIVAFMTYRDPFILPKLREEKQVAKKCRCSMNPPGAFSDHHVFLVAYEGYMAAYDRSTERQYCNQNFLSPVCMNMVYGVREQLKMQLSRVGYLSGDYAKFNIYSQDWPMIKAVLVAGSYPYLAYVDKEARKIQTRYEAAEISTHSTLLDGKRFSKSRCSTLLPSNWLVYNELSRVKRAVHLKCATAVNTLTVALLAGPMHLTRSDAVKKLKTCSIFENWDDSEQTATAGCSTFGKSEISVLDLGEFVFRCDEATATKVMLLREKIFSMLIGLIRTPWTSSKRDPANEAALNAVSTLLNAEDEACGLKLGPKPAESV